MRWRGERESENVEDRRDEGGGGFGFPFPGGGVMRFPAAAGMRGAAAASAFSVSSSFSA